MPRLTEQEQQEIVRFIEADRPLPEKYRFLLFEEKREVGKICLINPDKRYLPLEKNIQGILKCF